MAKDADQELLLNMDWLGLSLHMQSPPRPIPHHVWREYSATNVWGKRSVLWNDDGDRVCTLLWQPRSSIINAKSALLEIENEWLYHGIGVDGILSMLTKVCNFEVTGVSRLDLCVDFEPTEKQRDIIMGLDSGDFYVSGKQNGLGFWSTNSAECLHQWWTRKKIPHSQSWGHKTSSIKWKLYYKTRELWESGGWKFPHKPYIIDQWRQHGFDTSNVWRLEVSCKNLNDLSLYGQRLGLEALRGNLDSFWVSLYEQRFVVRRAQGHKDKSNDEKITFLPVPKWGRNVSQSPSLSSRQHSGRITLLRHLVQSLDDEHIFLDERTRHTVFHAITEIVERDHLQNYFREMAGQWMDEFMRKKDEEANMQYDLRQATSYVLPNAEGGSTTAERSFDMPQWREKFEIKPNLSFDSCVGSSAEWGLSEAAKEEYKQMREKIESLELPRKNHSGDSQVTIQFEPLE